MFGKFLISILALVSVQAFACFNDAGCPRGNICIKTGNLIGTCFSQAMPLYNQTPTIGSTAGQIAPAAGTSAYPNQIPTNSSTTSVTTGPVCTNDVNCPAGYACAKTGGSFRGICEQISQ